MYLYRIILKMGTCTEKHGADYHIENFPCICAINVEQEEKCLHLQKKHVEQLIVRAMSHILSHNSSGTAAMCLRDWWVQKSLSRNSLSTVRTLLCKSLWETVVVRPSPVKLVRYTPSRYCQFWDISPCEKVECQWAQLILICRNNPPQIVQLSDELSY